jgi:hypothetical protein
MKLLKALDIEDNTITLDYDKDGEIPKEGDFIIVGEEGEDEEIKLGEALYVKHGIAIFIIADRGLDYVDDEDDDI